MSDDNITKFPEQQKREDLLLGPFVGEYKVIVEGRVMPLLKGFWEGDKI